MWGGCGKVYGASGEVCWHMNHGLICKKGLPVTSPHGNFATVTLPQKLRHMVTLPHFEKVRGDVGIVGKCVGVWGEMWEEV